MDSSSPMTRFAETHQIKTLLMYDWNFRNELWLTPREIEAWQEV